MALDPQRYKGTARNGKIELEPGVKLPEGAEVVVLFDRAKISKADRLAARDRLIQAMKKGYDLGGGPYFNREELYGDTGRPR